MCFENTCLSACLFEQSNLHLRPPRLTLTCCHIQDDDVDFASHLEGGVVQPCKGIHAELKMSPKKMPHIGL